MKKLKKFIDEESGIEFVADGRRFGETFQDELNNEKEVQNTVSKAKNKSIDEVYNDMNLGMKFEGNTVRNLRKQGLEAYGGNTSRKRKKENKEVEVKEKKLSNLLNKVKSNFSDKKQTIEKENKKEEPKQEDEKIVIADEKKKADDDKILKEFDEALRAWNHYYGRDGNKPTNSSVVRRGNQTRSKDNGIDR